MIHTCHCKTTQMQQFKDSLITIFVISKTQHTTTTTQSKPFQEYDMSGKCNKKIKHNLKTSYKSTNLGFNITLQLCITKEGLVWKDNKSERVFANTTPTHDSLALSHNALSTYILCSMTNLDNFFESFHFHPFWTYDVTIFIQIS